jgi:hypothetical protein
MKVQCYCCGADFDKAPSQIRKSNGNNFCSRSCAAKVNNRITPKRKETSPSKESKLYETLGEVITAHLKSHKKMTANVFGGIRSRARYKIFNHKPKVCEKCGYNKHVEVCHKKSIASFDLSANIDNEINHADNLLVLCRNCHWEFDNRLWQ